MRHNDRFEQKEDWNYRVHKHYRRGGNTREGGTQITSIPPQSSPSITASSVVAPTPSPLYPPCALQNRPTDRWNDGLTQWHGQGWYTSTASPRYRHDSYESFSHALSVFTSGLSLRPVVRISLRPVVSIYAIPIQSISRRFEAALTSFDVALMALNEFRVSRR